jgi:hypothetical protein
LRCVTSIKTENTGFDCVQASPGTHYYDMSNEVAPSQTLSTGLLHHVACDWVRVCEGFDNRRPQRRQPFVDRSGMQGTQLTSEAGLCTTIPSAYSLPPGTAAALPRKVVDRELSSSHAAHGTPASDCEYDGLGTPQHARCDRKYAISNSLRMITHVVASPPVPGS